MIPMGSSCRRVPANGSGARSSIRPKPRPRSFSTRTSGASASCSATASSTITRTSTCITSVARAIGSSPSGAWGEGAVELTEAPAQNEATDNIVAVWRPKAPLETGPDARLWLQASRASRGARHAARRQGARHLPDGRESLGLERGRDAGKPALPHRFRRRRPCLLSRGARDGRDRRLRLGRKGAAHLSFAEPGHQGLQGRHRCRARIRAIGGYPRLLAGRAPARSPKPGQRRGKLRDASGASGAHPSCAR